MAEIRSRAWEENNNNNNKERIKKKKKIHGIRRKRGNSYNCPNISLTRNSTLLSPLDPIFETNNLHVM